MKTIETGAGPVTISKFHPYTVSACDHCPFKFSQDYGDICVLLSYDNREVYLLEDIDTEHEIPGDCPMILVESIEVELKPDVQKKMLDKLMKVK